MEYENLTTQNENSTIMGNTTTTTFKCKTCGMEAMSWDDATWILATSFIIFTMQTGFGMLEAGAVSLKNEVNIMVKNAVDVIFGGISYWAFGYGLSFGEDVGSNPFCGVGSFFVDATNDNMGVVFSTFVFQLSFATTATTIVSGMMAERTKLLTYTIFSFFNTLVYCIPAHWIWGTNGFLGALGVIDIAGSGTVHLLGAASGLVATTLLKPRLGRYDNGTKPLPLGNGTNSILGMFILWWGWLAFNCGSTFGISGGKWKLAAKSAATTLVGAMGGGASGMIYSGIRTKGQVHVPDLVNGILGALVSVTAGCAIIKPWEAIVIGGIGGLLAIIGVFLLDKLRVDDPVGGFGVHGVGGFWGMISVGLFASYDPIENMSKGQNGLFRGGGFYLLGVQLLACVCITIWSACMTLLILLPMHLIYGIRMSEDEEILGSDYVEHGIEHQLQTGVFFNGERIQSEPTLYSRRQSRRSTHILNNKVGSTASMKSYTWTVSGSIKPNDNSQKQNETELDAKSIKTVSFLPTNESKERDETDFVNSTETMKTTDNKDNENILINRRSSFKKDAEIERTISDAKIEPIETPCLSGSTINLLPGTAQ
ncbi:unnamed protein product [Owenia fusiformis]|uniref:Ammonium transporter n=1 Tax=Owenia fusiformis TaxID=6347 RepID=A0A8J1YAI1_OWEFU|nr:unnamed protein product [Owenia fusiformis]